jgi:hypothetical protein
MAHNFNFFFVIFISKYAALRCEMNVYVCWILDVGCWECSVHYKTKYIRCAKRF